MTIIIINNIIIIVIIVTIIIIVIIIIIVTISMNIKSSKTDQPYRFRLDLTDKLNLKNPKKKWL